MATNDHELRIGSTTRGLKLIRDDQNRAMYQVVENIAPHRDPLEFRQDNWTGGHGQYDFKDRNMYFEGQSIDTTQDGRIILGPLINEISTDLGANPVVMLWYDVISTFIVCTATKVFKLVGTAFTEVKEFAGETITSMVEYDEGLYAALGAGTLYQYSVDNAATTWTATDLTDGYANKIFSAPNAAGTDIVLWKSKWPNELSNTTNGKASGTQWSTADSIGDTSHDITNIFLHNDNMFIGREDNLFQYDSDGAVHQYMAELQQNWHADNFKYVTEYQGGIYFSLLNRIGEITSGNAFNVIGPLKDTGDIGKVGEIKGLTADKDFLYVAIDEGTNTIIYKGKKVGLKQWQWCPWVFLGTNACGVIQVVQHSPTDRRLWFGYANKAAYAIITDNPTTDSVARFCTSGHVRMSYDYGTNSFWDKLWQSAMLEVKGGASGETVQVKYRKDTDTSATECIAAAVTNGVFKSNFSSELNCKRIQFELHLASDTNTATPEVLSFIARGQEKPEVFRIHEATYAIGSQPSLGAETLRTFLRGGRTNTSLIRFSDLRYTPGGTGGTAGTDFEYVVMEPGYPREIEIVHTKGRKPELGIQVRLREVNFT